MEYGPQWKFSSMRVISKTGNSELATVYIAQNDEGRMVEFVESTQPPFTINEKWVLIVSTLFGCPVDCSFCDAGGKYQGRLTAEEILFQIDHPVRRRFPDGNILADKFKVQFSRMGEPTFNAAVLEVLERLPDLYTWKEFIPSLSTIAPNGTDLFFERLLNVKKNLFPHTFQLQFSLHSTLTSQRDKWIPVKKWDFHQIASYGEMFYQPGGRKITLNFAVAEDSIIDEKILSRYFSPERFLVKLTPVNPTFKASRNRIRTGLHHGNLIENEIALRIEKQGFEVILSLGEMEENLIGSNCGQYLQRYLNSCEKMEDAYSYKLI